MKENYRRDVAMQAFCARGDRSTPFTTRFAGPVSAVGSDEDQDEDEAVD
jgi:hypothetical protein